MILSDYWKIYIPRGFLKFPPSSLRIPEFLKQNIESDQLDAPEDTAVEIITKPWLVDILKEHIVVDVVDIVPKWIWP